jgi:hypothetical protein
VAIRGGEKTGKVREDPISAIFGGTGQATYLFGFGFLLGSKLFKLKWDHGLAYMVVDRRPFSSGCVHINN